MKKLAAALLGAAAFVSIGQAWAADLIVGVSWNNFQEERWKTDEAAMKKVLEADGVKYIATDAQSSAGKQLTDIENLISQGANVLIVLAHPEPQSFNGSLARVAAQTFEIGRAHV